MKVTLHFKLQNSEFDTDVAIALYDGEESEDNIKFLWEDEFEVIGEVSSFKIKNNAVFTLEGYMADNTKFSYSIPDMMIIECITKDGQVNTFPVSKKLIKSTDKKTDEKTGDIDFTTVLISKYEHVNPMDGAYFLQSDFPKELL